MECFSHTRRRSVDEAVWLLLAFDHLSCSLSNPEERWQPASFGSGLIPHSSFSHLLPYSLSIILRSLHPLCLCLPEGSMAHCHRNRQPRQVEIAGSAARHDTPCDRGMPTLWNQNEHCALSPGLPACVRAFTLRSVELVRQGRRAFSAFYTSSQRHCFTVEQDRVDRDV